MIQPLDFMGISWDLPRNSPGDGKDHDHNPISENHHGFTPQPWAWPIRAPPASLCLEHPGFFSGLSWWVYFRMEIAGSNLEHDSG
jgi:hypothetical protein